MQVGRGIPERGVAEADRLPQALRDAVMKVFPVDSSRRAQTAILDSVPR
jgi:hypothetical protein